MKLTIVLTIYNKELFLSRAFDALLGQEGVGNDDYEVLAVNDGSTDGSANIIDEYKEKDPRIRVLTQENQGLSMARNNGVKAALGEYVWFVDADDEIISNAVFTICEAIKSSPDIIPIYAQTDGIEAVRNAIDVGAKSGKGILLSKKWENCSVFYVCKKTFLLNYGLSFFPGIYHEDAEFTPRMLYFAKSVKVVPNILYKVYRDPESITQVPRPKRAFDCLIIARRLCDFIVDNGEHNTLVGKAIYYDISVDLNMAFLIISQNSKKEQLLFNKKFYENRDNFIHTLSVSQVFKYRLEAFFLRLFPKRSVDVYKKMKMFG